MTVQPSQKAIDFIIDQEDGSELWYNAHAIHPVCPGGSSGVTLGVGYDCGQQTASVIVQDWVVALGAANARRLSVCAGKQGHAAALLIPGLRDIIVPWKVAVQAFTASTLPRYAAQTHAALPNCDGLNGDQFGALVSIGYNRGNGGWTMTDDRHREMAEIHRLVGIKDFFAVPTLIRGMQRLWPVDSDLWERREAEAQLFEGTLE